MYHPPTPEATKAAILEALKEDRLDFPEIAALHSVSVPLVSKIANDNGLSRKDRRGKTNRSSRSKVHNKKSTSRPPEKIETFDDSARLLLLDEALSIHKAQLHSVKNAYEMEKWASALDRLFNQRREEAPPLPPEDESDGFMEALEKKTSEVWKDVDAEADAVQVDPVQPQAMADSDLVDQE